VRGSGHRRRSTRPRQPVEQTITNDAWFAFVCGLDPGDDWTDEAVWPKANPNLGVSIFLRYLREQVAEALGMPARQGVVQRLNFCVWTSASAGAIDLARWDACADPVAIPDGATVYGGLDLSSTTDLAALALDHQDADGDVHLL
jgi:phage terminase large subunit-like protein